MLCCTLDGLHWILEFGLTRGLFTCLQAELKTEGFKVETATLATENILNIKLHSSEDLSHVRNLNFLIPPEASAKKVSVEIFDDTIFVRAPLKKKKHT